MQSGWTINGTCRSINTEDQALPLQEIEDGIEERLLAGCAKNRAVA